MFLQSKGSIFITLSLNQDKIKEKSAEITELKENLDLINDSISATKSVTYCPECGSDVPENSKFCNSCGAKLDEDKAQL